MVIDTNDWRPSYLHVDEFLEGEKVQDSGGVGGIHHLHRGELARHFIHSTAG